MQDVIVNGEKIGYVVKTGAQYEAWVVKKLCSPNIKDRKLHGLFDTPQKAEQEIIFATSRGPDTQECPDCRGRGQNQNGGSCEMCQGLGRIRM